MKSLFSKYRHLIMYGIFGVLTTAVNIVTYYLFYNLLHVANTPSTALAWVSAVLFAFFTNKRWVFDSPSFDCATLCREIPSFFAARIATGAVDVGIMYLAVDICHQKPLLWKCLSNVIVVILNYIFSRLFVFRNGACSDGHGCSNDAGAADIRRPGFGEKDIPS